MNRKKAIVVSALVETVVLGTLITLFLKGVMSIELFLGFAVLVGIVFSLAVMLIFKHTEP